MIKYIELLSTWGFLSSNSHCHSCTISCVFLCFLYLVLGIEPRALHVPGSHTYQAATCPTPFGRFLNLLCLSSWSWIVCMMKIKWDYEWNCTWYRPRMLLLLLLWYSLSSLVWSWTHNNSLISASLLLWPPYLAYHFIIPLTRSFAFTYICTCICICLY